MKKLWVFGDSFTDQYIISNNTRYCNWKGYVPKTFSQVISEKLNLDVVNFSKSYGMDNYTIFQQICSNSNLINNSIIIINWSEPIRFRMVDTSLEKWRTIIPSNSRANKGLPYVNGVDNHVVDGMFLNRSHSLYLDEVTNWITLINKALSNNIIIHWSWYNNTAYQTITNETNGDVIDFHYSELGHLDLANWILLQIENGGYLKSPFANTSLI